MTRRKVKLTPYMLWIMRYPYVSLIQRKFVSCDFYTAKGKSCENDAVYHFEGSRRSFDACGMHIQRVDNIGTVGAFDDHESLQEFDQGKGVWEKYREWMRENF